MPTPTDHSTLTNDQSSADEARMRAHRLTQAVWCGVLVGTAVWSATHNGGWITYALLGAVLLIARRTAPRAKQLRTEEPDGPPAPGGVARDG
jgi:hypothetical protein